MCDRADYEHTLRCTYAERDQLKERLKKLEEELDKRAQIAVNAINRAEKAETRVGQLDLQLQLMVQVCEKLEARIKELGGTLKDLRGHLVDGLDDDAYLVLVIDRALAAAEKEES
jgi:chromosome segregation ATPase